MQSKPGQRGENVALLSTSRPLHGKTIDDGKEKSQIIKLYHFTKGGSGIADQFNDYYTTRAKSCQWVMVTLFYMLHTARLNRKTDWCLKHKEEI